MKSTEWAAAIGSLLFLATSPTEAADIKPAVRAAFTVYSYIVETESVIDTCRRVESVDAASYDALYNRYQGEVRQTVIRIGFVVGREFRRAGADKQDIWKLLASLIDQAGQTAERAARLDPERFALGCRALPDAIIAKTKPFEPITEKFRQEMQIITKQ